MGETIRDSIGAATPLEVYLRSSEYEPDAEYVDGEVEQRPMGEFDHNGWQQAIQLWFWQHAKEWNTRVVPEQRVRVAETRFRVPDVTVLDRNRAIEQMITHPPIAVFEVLSPEDTFRRVNRKLEDYRAMGIPQIWVINPEAMTIQVELSAETEARLSVQAAAHSMELPAYVATLLKRAASSAFPELSHSGPRRPADRKSLARLFAESPFKGLDLDFERDPDLGREIPL